MDNEWKIYTKTGDLGLTSLIGGDRIKKSDDRIEAYGSIDELNSFIALVRDLSSDSDVRAILLAIEDNLFTIESYFAAATLTAIETLPHIQEEDIENLEQEIDKMNENIPPLNSFILPGGHPLISQTHIARTVCRRAERAAIRVMRDSSHEKMAIKYLNRLSDYLFVLARKFAVDLKIKEIKWEPSY
ncbi:MAG: cob(I)yrinic acid a,c-diamide adenosyltransferase [Bacteroidales bacterium]|jgi:cob(I)alamin adenosyltransferase|nr:cob(I)yrinic acid a,c-diamide adenosyltransferase [Bacteroidales bacterium]